MYWDVTTVQPQKPFTLKVTFIDGVEGTVHFMPSRLTGVFEPLKNERFFNQVFIDHGVLTWPGNLDLAPDTMYAEIKQYGQWILK